MSLLCKVHELEIDKVKSQIKRIYSQLRFQVEMKSEALLKEHEVRRRDLLILKYDKQRSLCDEIILRQQKLIEGITAKKNHSFKLKCLQYIKLIF